MGIKEALIKIKADDKAISTLSGRFAKYTMVKSTTECILLQFNNIYVIIISCDGELYIFENCTKTVGIVAVSKPSKLQEKIREKK